MEISLLMNVFSERIIYMQIQIKKSQFVDCEFHHPTPNATKKNEKDSQLSISQLVWKTRFYSFCYFDYEILSKELYYTYTVGRMNDAQYLCMYLYIQGRERSHLWIRQGFFSQYYIFKYV